MAWLSDDAATLTITTFCYKYVCVRPLHPGAPHTILVVKPRNWLIVYGSTYRLSTDYTNYTFTMGTLTLASQMK